MQLWEPLHVSYAVLPLAGITVTSIILLVVAFVYYFNIRKVKPHEAPGKFVMLFSTLIYFIRGLVVDVIGPKHVKLTPYFLLLFTWIATSNIIVLIGFKEVATALTVPLVFALTTWITSQVLAVKYQKWSYFNKFMFRIKIKGVKIPVMINPIEIIGKVVPIISLTFRLWGNITAGATIYALLWWAFGGFTEPYPQIGILLIAATIIFPFIYAYFAVFIGVIQAFVFTLLSTTYWSQEINEGIEHHEKLKQEKLLKQQQKLVALEKENALEISEEKEN